MKDCNFTENGCIYGKWETDFGAWQIQVGGNALYLLVGTEKALLIDTGYGEGDLTDIIESITSLPVMAVNTHGHYDHSSGNGFFEEVWMGEGGQKDASEVEAREKLPHPDYKIHILEDGQIIDLGGRSVEAIAIGAHSKCSFAFLDREERALYTGDEIESGQVLLFVHGEDISNDEVLRRHMANMQKLKGRSGEFDRLCPAHNGGPLHVNYIDDYIVLAKKILEGSVQPEKSCVGYGWPLGIFGGDEALVRYKYGKASFILQK